MKITFKPYRRRYGALMLIVSGDNGCSIGLDDSARPASRLNRRQQQVFDASESVFKFHSLPFAGDIRLHRDEQARCGPYTLVLTDDGAISGEPVGNAGSFLVRDGRILAMGEYNQPVKAAGIVALA